MSVTDDARELQPELQALRRALHQEPEIGLDLPRTQEKLLAALDPLGLETTTGTALSSITAVLRGGAAPDADRPTVLLRADMDALPVQEATGVEYISRIDGRMHACGHDLHMAMLVGAARLLHARRDELPGDVVLMLQPGEEGYAGGRLMVEEGVLDAAGRRVDAAYGMHVFSSLNEHGALITKPGPMLAASDRFQVTVRGRGGHGSTPSLAIDPVPIAAEIVLAVNSAVTRRLDVFDPAVVTFGVLRAGTQGNVIPDDAFLEATVRTFSDRQQAQLEEMLPHIATKIAEAHGATAECVYRREYPVTTNDEAETERAAAVVEELFDGRHVRWGRPLGGSEDFSFVLREVPGTFVGLSAVPPGVDPLTQDFNHSPRALFDDSVLADGAAVYAQLALSRLAEPAGA